MPERNHAKIPDRKDITLAADADLNKTWEQVENPPTGNKKFRSPRERITVNEALVGQSRIQTSDDVATPHTKN